MKNHIKGTLKMEGRQFEVENAHYDNLLKEFKDKLESSLYRLYSVSWSQGKSNIELYLFLAKDFRFFYGACPALEDEYGEEVNFIAPADSMEKGIELIEKYLR